MAITEALKNELSMGLKLIAFRNASAQFPANAQITDVDEAMTQIGWSVVSKETTSGSSVQRYYYDTAQKNYVLASLTPATGACSFEKAEESDVLEKLSFPELKVLAGLIDKKSVAFIRIYSEKELASAATEEERSALNARNQKMIDEAEVALRKR